MAAEWYLAREGQQTLGPLTTQQLKQMAAAGEVQATHLVWKQGMPRWVPAGQVKGLLGGSGEVPSLSSAAMGAATREGNGRGAEPPEQGPAAEAPPPGQEEDDRLPRGSEPWYYRFLERYATLATWLAVVTCCLGFLGLVLVSITWATREEGATGILAAGFAIVLGVLVFGLALLAGLFLVAMVLLAVDAARNLRKLVRKMDKD